MAKSRQFSVFFAIGFTILVGLYAWLFKTTIVTPDPVVPHSYKHFLLEYVEGPRIIVESGSNGYHSIDGQLMESLTGYPTIILSDYAAASLSDKIERLYTYAHPGDIIIMPLEWGYYISDDLSWLHLRTSIDDTNFYYHSLPLISQLKRAFETPWSIVCNQCYGASWDEDDFFGQMDRIDNFLKKNLRNAPCGGAGNTEWQRKSAKESNCDDYIFSKFTEARPDLSNDFKDSMGKLSRLQRDKGVRVIIIPPVVVGYDCYQRGGEKLAQLFPQAEEVFKENHLDYLEDYERYVFGGDHFLNTHYHIDEDAREAYTPMILGDLVAADLIQVKDRSGSSLIEQIPGLVSKMREELFERDMPGWKGNLVSILDGRHQGLFFLGADWNNEENWGIWAKGEEAEIVFHPGSPGKYYGIRLEGRYFNGSQETAIYINDQLVGRHDFSISPDFYFGKSLRKWMGDSSVVHMRFESSDLKSPLETGAGNDERPLKFGIDTLQLLGK